MPSSTKTLANLADYQERRAAYHLANGNADRAEICLRNAAHYRNEIASRGE